MQDLENLPPGTHRIEDSRGEHVVLSPQPNSDPNQPLNWKPWRKALHMTILCFYSIMVFAILCVSTPLWQDFNEDLGISYDVLNDSYATNMAALSVGCIFFVPFALWIGRRPVYIATSLIMLASAIWQAKMRTSGDLIGCMIIAGIAGAVNETLFQVTVTDLFFVHQRGTMNGIYLIVVLIGNYFGPVAAGYVEQSQGWPWVFWWCTIFMAIITIVMIFALEETKYTPPMMVDNKAERIPSNEGPSSLITDTTKAPVKSITTDSTEATASERRRLVDIDWTIPMKSYWQRHGVYYLDSKETTEKHHFLQHVWQPFQILAIFPAVMFAALQYGFSIAMLAILAVTQASIYVLPPYNFSVVEIGNMNIPPAIGAILGALFGGPLVDYFILQVAKRRGGIYQPETRLWLFLVPGLSMAIGSLMYGLTIAQGMPWILSAVGAGFIGFAIGGCGDMALTYVQDSYQHILGDALIGVVFIRNVIATALVFAIPPWMTNRGVYNMFVLLGVISTLIALTCIPMIIWGRRWRTNLALKYEYYAARQY